MKIINLTAIICSVSVTIQKSKDPNHNFEGILAPVYNSILPRKKFYINSIANTECSMGYKLKNQSYNGMYNDLIQQNSDFILFWAKDQLLYDDFFYSSTNILDQIIFIYFFNVKSNNLSILSNVKKISLDIIILLLTVNLINFSFVTFKKKIFYKFQKLISTIFISFFLTNYILGCLNILLIEFDKTNYISTLKELSVSSYYKPIMVSKELENIFETSDEMHNKLIWQRFKKVRLHPTCIYEADFDEGLQCLNFVKNNNLALIIQETDKPYVESPYCAENNHILERNDRFVWFYSEPFMSISNYFPYNKKIDPYKREKLDRHVETLFSMGLFIKVLIEIARNLKKQFKTENSDCVSTKKNELLDNSFFFTQLVFENYETLFIILICFQTIIFILFSLNYLTLFIKISRKKLIKF